MVGSAACKQGCFRSVYGNAEGCTVPMSHLSYRDPNYVPQMTRHKASGRAVVRLHGKDHYLGPWGSREATVAYHKLVAEWQEHKERPALPPMPEPSGLTVNELCLAFLKHAESYYRKDGKPTAE